MVGCASGPYALTYAPLKRVLMTASLSTAYRIAWRTASSLVGSTLVLISQQYGWPVRTPERAWNFGSFLARTQSSGGTVLMTLVSPVSTVATRTGSSVMYLKVMLSTYPGPLCLKIGAAQL